MKTTKRLISAMVMISMVGVSAIVNAGVITRDISFDTSQLVFGQKEMDGTIYSDISYGSLFNNGETGKPSLPVKVVRILVPTNSRNFTVSVSSTAGETSYELEHLVCPVEEPSVTGEEASLPAGFTYDQSPVAVSAHVVGDGFADGSNHIVTVKLTPVSYTPSSNLIKAYSNIGIKLSYDACTESQLATKPIHTLHPTFSAAEFNDAGERLPQTTSISDRLPYFIITSDSLKEAFEDLAMWKRQKGYDVKIVTMDEIYAMPETANGDTISGINDNAGKLRAYLQYVFKNYGKSFILLGGDDAHVPIRYAYYNKMGIQETFPCDWYFSELNSNWDTNRNGIYGEISTIEIEMEYELLLSRLICSKAKHVENYTKKMILYEGYPGLGDTNYLSSLFGFLQLQWIGDINVTDFCDDLNLTPTIIEEDKVNRPYPTGSDIIQKLNENNYGFICFHGHGSPTTIATSNVWVNGTKRTLRIHASSAHKVWSLRDEVYGSHTNCLDYLKNDCFPAIGYSTSCNVCPFDRTNPDGNVNYEGEFCFGSSFTCGEGYGGVAFFGSTRDNYFSFFPMTNIHSQKIAIDPTISSSLAEAKQIYSTSSFNMFKALLYHEIGEPELKIWLGEPSKLSISPNISTTQASLIGSDIGGSSLYIIDEDNIVNQYNMKGINSLDIAQYVGKSLSIWKDGCLPFIYYYNKGNFTNKVFPHYIVHKSHLGTSPTQALILNKCQLKLNVMQNITIESLSTSNGSQIEILNYGNADIHKLGINSSNVLITGKCITIRVFSSVYPN